MIIMDSDSESLSDKKHKKKTEEEDSKINKRKINGGIN